MRKHLLILFLFLFQLHANSQSVEGLIKDSETAEPLLNVSILGPNKTGTISDIDGFFSLPIVVGNHKLKVSILGYQSQEIDVNISSSDQVKKINISLQKQSVSLETVVLSAGKFEQNIKETTVSLEVIKPTLVQEKNTIQLQDAFNQTPGVNVVEDQVNIRSGSGWSFGAGSRVLMMVDDMPLMSPDAGQIQWKLLPNESIYQMEVIKGASSALYGTSAINGLINVRTAIPTSKPTTEVSVFGGIHDAPKRNSLKWWDGNRGFMGTTFLHSRKIKKSEFVFSGTLLKDQGFRYQEVDDRARFNIKTQFYPQKVKGLSWGFNASALYSKGGDALLWWDYDNAYIPRDSSATQTEGWDYYIDPFITYKRKHGKHTLKSRYMGINNNARTELVNYENFSDYIYLEYQYQHFFENYLTISAGAVGSLGYSNSEVFDGYHESKNGALYIQADKKWSRITVSGGLRYEAYKLDARTFSKPVIRAGINYKVSRATFIRASYGGGYRFPSMAETYTNTFVGSTGVYPNHDLQPESGWTAELGVKQGFKVNETWKGLFDLAGFINHFDNMTEFTFGLWGSDPNPLNNLGFRSLNVGATEITGIEATVTSTGKIGDVDLRILTGYAFTKPISLEPDKVYGNYTNLSGPQEVTYTSTSSNPENNILKYRYKHLFKLDAIAEYKGFGLGFSIKYNDYMQNIDKIFEESLGTIEFFPGVKTSRETLTGGDLIFDARIFYQVQAFRFSVIVDNLTNTEFSPRPSYMGPPRKFTLKITYKI